MRFSAFAFLFAIGKSQNLLPDSDENNDIGNTGIGEVDDHGIEDDHGIANSTVDMVDGAIDMADTALDIALELALEFYLSQLEQICEV